MAHDRRKDLWMTARRGFLTARGKWFAAAGAATTAGALLAPVSAAGAAPRHHGFTQTNLVSDVPGLAALTDPMVSNPWGLSLAPTPPLWGVNNTTTPTPRRSTPAPPPPYPRSRRSA